MDSGSPLRYARNDKLALAKAGKGVIIYNKVTTAIFWGREAATASISLGASSLRERARGMNHQQNEQTTGEKWPQSKS